MKKILTLLVLLILALQTLKAQGNMSNEIIFQNFVTQINEHNVEGLMNMVSAEHTYIDERGFIIMGKDNIENQWRLYFNMFPDYEISINNFMEKGSMILAEGEAGGTYGEMKTASGDNRWSVPASWKVIIDNNKIKSWQIFADTKAASDIINNAKSIAPAMGDKVTGIGGVFIKSKDPNALREWYNKHLGTTINDYSYMSFEWSERGNANSKASTTFAFFSDKSKYFDPSTSEFMINFRVKDLHKLLTELKAEGVTVMEKIEEADYGKFGWIMDIDGNKVELWEPVDEVLDEYEKNK